MVKCTRRPRTNRERDSGDEQLSVGILKSVHDRFRITLFGDPPTLPNRKLLELAGSILTAGE
jgi:hypothetical protein